MDTGDSKIVLSERNKFPASASHTVYAELPVAFHKQHSNVDVTEIQLQFTWQFDAAYSHMTTH